MVKNLAETEHCTSTSYLVFAQEKEMLISNSPLTTLLQEQSRHTACLRNPFLLFLHRMVVKVMKSWQVMSEKDLVCRPMTCAKIIIQSIQTGMFCVSQHLKISDPFFNYPFSIAVSIYYCGKPYTYGWELQLCSLFFRSYVWDYFILESLTPAADFEHLKVLANLDLNVSLTTFDTVWNMWKVVVDKVREGGFFPDLNRKGLTANFLMK